jgi:N-acyl-D-aspartate/D-glutamate deacylase
MLDLKIKNGWIVDGTGRERYRGDIGVHKGQILAVGEVWQEARETLDADGLIVAPGFVDAHTHYDAQAFWDPRLTPSCFHGVTTVVGGFCGFSIAPVTPDSAAYIRPMLARVEGMPLETLEAAVPWGAWSSFGGFLDQLEGKVGLNAGFFCGHSAIRRMAMGERAVGERATAEELEEMKWLLDQSLSEGALGFSTTISPTHNDGAGDPVPSRWADFSELIALAEVVKGHEGAGLELLPNLEFGPEVVELMADFSVAGGRPVNWNALVVAGDLESAARRAEKQLQVSDLARRRGGEVIALTIPNTPTLYVNLRDGVAFASLPGLWRTIFKTPVAERLISFRDPVVRRRLAEDAATMPTDSPLIFKTRFGDHIVVGASSPANKPLEGRHVRDIAAERGCEPLEAMLDIALEDGLDTIFTPDLGGEDRAAYELRGRLWRDDRTLIGASDAGAHLDVIDTFAFSTVVLQKGVRQFGVIGLEEAVHRMTERPARYFGLVGRGRLAPGMQADIVVFDEATVGRAAPYMRFDVPGGAGRVYAEATGVPHVFVNGVQVVKDGAHTGALPGKVLRSGKDTRTPAMDALRAVEPAE